MGNDTDKLESLLTVGGTVIFQPDPHLGEGPRYSSVICGWRKSSYIILERPTSLGRLAAHRENQRCVIRFLREGNAYAFESRVVSWDPQAQKAHCRIEWPDHFDVMTFRKHERVRIQVACRITLQSSTVGGQIEDISLGGCRLCSSRVVETGSRLKLSFLLPDGGEVSGLECAVRNVRKEGEAIFLGCEFVPGQAFVETTIACFMATMVDRSGKRATGTQSVMVIDGNAERAATLRVLLEGRGCNVVTVTQSFDGLVRLPVARPTALLINHDQEELPGQWLARLVKKTPGLDWVTVYIYNYAESDSEEQVRLLSLAGCFGADEPLAQIASDVSAHIQELTRQQA